MCSLVFRFEPTSSCPLVLAANRDELASRPWDPPARHWPDRPQVLAGRDRLAGGSWLGVNDFGVVAAVLNRVGSLGPAPGKRSRGELVLEALDHARSADAAAALADLDPRAWRPFNLFVGDLEAAFWIRHDGETVTVVPVTPGVHMLTARELDDPACPRIRRHLPLFRTAAPPEPEAPETCDWRLLLAAHAGVGADALAGMCVHTDGDYGTVSSSLLLLDTEGRMGWHFAAGPPCRTPYRLVRASARSRQGDG